MTLNKIIGMTAAIALLGIGSAYANDSADAKHQHKHGQVWQKLDADQDGKISYDEFRTAQEKRMEQHFRRMDANGDGFIDQSERQAMRDKWEQHKRKVKGERCQKADKAKTL
ncbi:MAG TPA: EF-hand domain-containing protein [Methylophilaceae bacterium]|jgi:uncharacterized membrane protein YebE (DUF533 family)